MFDPSERHADPFGEALSYSSQRAAQMVSVVATATEVAIRRRTLKTVRQAARDDHELRVLQAQEGAFRAHSRARWAPALDSRWLAQADLLQAGCAWGAAAPWADTDPEAATALRRTEKRLRTLHPYAMTQYDRLRDEGASPVDAMRRCVHLFLREPHARPGEPTPARRAVDVGTGPAPEPVGEPDSPAQQTPGHDPYHEWERRGHDIAKRLQARALQERGAQFSPDELATALEATTSLPSEVIPQIARADAEERLATAAERARASDLGHAATEPSPRVRADDLKAARRDTQAVETASAHASADRTTAQLAAESFPCTAAHGIQAAIAGRLQPTQSADRAATIQNTSLLTVSS